MTEGRRNTTGQPPDVEATRATVDPEAAHLRAHGTTQERAPATVVDELVPAPWPTSRRLLVSGLIATVVALGGLGWWSGAIVPHLALGSIQGGTVQGGAVEDGRVMDTTVTVHVPIENRGRADATVTAWEPPPTDGIDWHPTAAVLSAAQATAGPPPTLDDDWPPPAASLPVTLSPGERIELVLAASVDDCLDVHAHGAAGFGVVAEGPLLGERSRPLSVRGAGSTPDWLGVDDGRGHLDPSPREPSWIYDTLGWACSPEVHETS